MQRVGFQFQLWFLTLNFGLTVFNRNSRVPTNTGKRYSTKKKHFHSTKLNCSCWKPCAKAKFRGTSRTSQQIGPQAIFCNIWLFFFSPHYYYLSCFYPFLSLDSRPVNLIWRNLSSNSSTHHFSTAEFLVRRCNLYCE